MPNTCATCRHFVKIPANRSVHNDCVGECRARPPAADWKWPKVRDVDYCSEHASFPVAFATVAPDAKPGSIIPAPVSSAPVLFAAPAAAPAPAPIPATAPVPTGEELPLSLDAGQAAPKPADAAKTPPADAPGATRPRSAKASPKAEAPATGATGAARVE